MKQKTLNQANQAKQSDKGFTLIETIIALVVFVLALGAVVALIIMAYRGEAYTFQQALTVNEARRGIETMVKELREAQTADNGSYLLEKATDYEIVFYSDIDQDGDTERVRYFFGENGSSTNDCVSYAKGGSCNVDLPNFSSGTIESAEVEVCVEGDLDQSSEYVDISADGSYLGALCQTGCNQCAGTWEGCTTFDVTSQAADGSITFTADGSSAVGYSGGGFCDWQQENHSMKARFVFSWSEAATGETIALKKGVINPSGYPIEYPAAQEQVTVLSNYVRNALPIFQYFDGDGNELAPPARLEATKLIRVYLVINVNPERPPQDFELESTVQIRNLKTNL